MELDKKLIGIRIMQRRKSCGLTQEELSETIGFSKNHLSSIERGKFVPTTQFIFKICNVLGETPDYYLIGKLSEDADEITELVRCLPDNAQHMCCTLLKTLLQEIQDNNNQAADEV